MLSHWKKHGKYIVIIEQNKNLVLLKANTCVALHNVVIIIDHLYQTNRSIQDMASTHPWNKAGGSCRADLPRNSRRPGLYLRGMASSLDVLP
jgi:hypothetical protein